MRGSRAANDYPSRGLALGAGKTHSLPHLAAVASGRARCALGGVGTGRCPYPRAPGASDGMRLARTTVDMSGVGQRLAGALAEQAREGHFIEDTQRRGIRVAPDPG